MVFLLQCRSKYQDQFSLSFLLVKATRCAHYLKNDNGTITTPNYPQDYPASLSCVWTISAPEGYYIQLKFMDFDVEPYEDCKTDLLEIKDGGTKNSPLIGNLRCSGGLVCFSTSRSLLNFTFNVNPFQSNVTFLYPLKMSDNTGFLTFSGGIEM